MSITCDLWTSPNQKSILGVTAHWINRKEELKEILLEAIELKGHHTGANISDYILKILEDFGLKERLFCITADNASNNMTMAQQLGSKTIDFDSKQHLLGCTGHVFNLAAKAGLSALGHETEDVVFESDPDDNLFTDYDKDGWGSDSDEEENEGNEIGVSEVVSPKTVVDRIRKIVKDIRRSPQKRKLFEDTVKVAYPNLFEAPKPKPSSARPAKPLPVATRSAPPRAASKTARTARYYIFSNVMDVMFYLSISVEKVEPAVVPLPIMIMSSLFRIALRTTDQQIVWQQKWPIRIKLHLLT